MKLLWIMLKGNLTYVSNIMCITFYALSLNNNACRNTVRSRRRMNEPAGWRVSVFLGSGGPLPPKMAKKGGINSVFSFFSIAIFLGRVSDLLFRGAPPPSKRLPLCPSMIKSTFLTTATPVRHNPGPLDSRECQHT